METPAATADEASRRERLFSHHWKDWLRRIVSLSLLIFLICGIGSFYSKELIRGMFCLYYCDVDEIPNRLLREFLNGRPDSDFRYYDVGSKDADFYEEGYPVERPTPDDGDHYYAVLAPGVHARSRGAGSVDS